MPRNWVKASLADQDYGLYEVDGYTVQNDEVTALLDYISDTEIENGVNRQSIEEIRGSDAVSAKITLSERLGCPYYIVHYNSHIYVYGWEGEDLEHKSTFASAGEFGQWTMQMRERAITKYTRDTSSWTSLEQELIENDVGAPGDLDSFIYRDGEVQAIIEWQTTNKKSPEDHSNNRWFSDDIGRWRPLWSLSQQLGVPLVIIVWSPKSKYPGVRIKVVKDIKFEGKHSGLSYSSDQNIDNAKQNPDKISKTLSNAVSGL